jgi:hypothetical protein
LKLVRCPRSLAANLAALPSISENPISSIQATGTTVPQPFCLVHCAGSELVILVFEQHPANLRLPISDCRFRTDLSAAATENGGDVTLHPIFGSPLCDVFGENPADFISWNISEEARPPRRVNF